MSTQKPKVLLFFRDNFLPKTLIDIFEDIDFEDVYDFKSFQKKLQEENFNLILFQLKLEGDDLKGNFVFLYLERKHPDTPFYIYTCRPDLVDGDPNKIIHWTTELDVLKNYIYSAIQNE